VFHAIRKKWDFVVAALAACMGAAWLAPAIISSITPELIAFFTIQSAVILPAMIFTAGLLRGDGLTVAEIDRYQDAMRKQMYFWVVLLFTDLLAVTILIVGKAADWKLKVTVLHYTANLGWVMMGAATFLATLAILRMVPFVSGVVSLFELNSLLAKKRLQDRERRHLAKDTSDLPPTAFDTPEKFGKIIPHGRRRSKST
jgi:hypothetical protein